MTDEMKQRIITAAQRAASNSHEDDDAVDRTEIDTVTLLGLLELLEEQKPKWHVFHENEDGVMDVECFPNNCEQILWFRKYSGDVSVTTWDDDEWAEYACNTDGENFEDGDAWMELPSKPR